MIAACWVDDAKVRPSLSQVISGISAILAGVSREGYKISGLISMSNDELARLQLRKAAELEAAAQLTPGDPWRSVETNKGNITLGEVLGQVGWGMLCHHRSENRRSNLEQILLPPRAPLPRSTRAHLVARRPP